MANWKGKFSGLEQIPDNACGVYCLQCLANGKLYIGSSKNIRNRIQQHFSKLRKNKHDNPNLQQEFNSEGEDGFMAFVLKECNPTELLKFEQFYLNTQTGWYNVFKYADGSILPEEVKKKISLAQIGNTYGIGNINALGNKHTKEARRKISLANSKRRLSAETRRKISNKLSGRRLSSEHRKNISISLSKKH